MYLNWIKSNRCKGFKEWNYGVMGNCRDKLVSLRVRRSKMSITTKH